jgi:hypothetical protein
MIIWGTRTKREGVGFVLEGCPRCQVERVHFVAQARTKFTLYFVPTFTTSSKALLICTECESDREIDGTAGKALIERAVPPEVLTQQLQQGQADAAAAAFSPEESLAVALVAIALSAAAADGHVDDNEAVAVSKALETIVESTASDRVRDIALAAGVSFGDIVGYVASPVTEPLAVMFARAGATARELPMVDQYRLVGQLSWLCHTIAGAGGGNGDEALDAMDRAFDVMGYSPREISDALAYCQASGG